MTVSLLIVDDTEHVRQMLVDILSLHGFEIVAKADTGTTPSARPWRRSRTWW
jgi:YesN/AraC family two-component response regulator